MGTGDPGRTPRKVNRLLVLVLFLVALGFYVSAFFALGGK